MTHPVHHVPWFVFIPFFIGMGFVITWFYLMLVKPELWLEWFLNRPYRWWGLQVTIVDKERFKKATRFYAMIPVIGAVAGLLGVLIALLSHH